MTAFDETRLVSSKSSYIILLYFKVGFSFNVCTHPGVGMLVVIFLDERRRKRGGRRTCAASLSRSWPMPYLDLCHLLSKRSSLFCRNPLGLGRRAVFDPGHVLAEYMPRLLLPPITTIFKSCVEWSP